MSQHYRVSFYPSKEVSSLQCLFRGSGSVQQWVYMESFHNITLYLETNSTYSRIKLSFLEINFHILIFSGKVP